MLDTRQNRDRENNVAASVMKAVVGVGLAAATIKVLSDKKTRGKVKSKSLK